MLFCFFFINSFWNHRSIRSTEKWTWTEIGFWSTYTLRRARSTDTHPTCSPGGRRGVGGEEGARQIAVCPGVKHSAVMPFFFYLFLLWRPCESVEDILSLCVRLEKPGSYAWCVIKPSRAAIACQNSSTCVCVSDCGSTGDLPGPPPPTHTHGSRLKYEKKKII